jgi:hypothetical protein
MRLRSIFPTLWQNEDFAALSWDARFMLMGLWSYADDEGRGLDKVALIAAALFPFDVQRDPRKTFARVSAAVDELAAAGRVIRYQVDGTSYIQIADWRSSQKPQRPTPSRFPTPSLRNPPEPSGGFPLGVRSSEFGVRSSEGEGPENDPEPSGSADAPSLTPTTIDAQLIDDDPEPPPYCPQHMPHGTGVSCRACKTARINHDRWLVRHNGHPVQVTPSTADLRVAQTQALKAKFRTNPELLP